MEIETHYKQNLKAQIIWGKEELNNLSKFK